MQSWLKEWKVVENVAKDKIPHIIFTNTFKR